VITVKILGEMYLHDLWKTGDDTQHVYTMARPARKGDGKKARKLGWVEINFWKCESEHKWAIMTTGKGDPLHPSTGLDLIRMGNIVDRSAVPIVVYERGNAELNKPCIR